MTAAQTPVLMFYDEKGSERAWFGFANDTSPSLALCDKNGTVRIAMGIEGADNKLGFGIFDEKGNAAVSISNDPDKTSLYLSGNRSAINLRSGKLRNQLSIEAGPGDKAYVLTSGDDGRKRLAFGSGPGNKAGLEVWDATGRYRIGLGILQGKTGLALVGDDGKPFFQIPKEDTHAK